ncbi:Restin-like protein [Trichoplax sp. H2]|nr:Restin-like protein [Trichoplax sp. H2]|eukprot:RDD47306.1 Restin-like protein [Trichoplax sp. H2]
MSRIPSNFGKSKIGQPSNGSAALTRTGSTSSSIKPSSGLKPLSSALKPPSAGTKISKISPASSVKSFSTESSRSSSPTRRPGLQAPKGVGEIKKPVTSGLKAPIPKTSSNKANTQTVKKSANAGLAKPKTKTTEVAQPSKKAVPKLTSSLSKPKAAGLHQSGHLQYGGSSAGTAHNASRSQSSSHHVTGTDVTRRPQTSLFKKSTSTASLSGVEGYEIGDRVMTSGNKLGTVSYVGKTQFSSGMWIGVTLDEPLGKNDGSVSGVEYFRCAPKYGIFCRPENVEPDRTFVLRPSSRVSSMSSLISGMESIAEEANAEVTVGDRVIVYGKTGTRKQGTLRYLGSTIFASGEWAGVELDDASGKNNGAVSGTRYFTCPPKHGLFVPSHKVAPIPVDDVDDFPPDAGNISGDRDNDKEMIELEQQLLQQQFELLEQQMIEEGDSDEHSNGPNLKESDENSNVLKDNTQVNLEPIDTNPIDTDADFEAIEKQINESLHMNEENNKLVSPAQPHIDSSVEPIANIEDQSPIESGTENTVSNQLDNNVDGDYLNLEEAVKSIDEITKPYEDDNWVTGSNDGNSLESDSVKNKEIIEEAGNKDITDNVIDEAFDSDNKNLIINLDGMFKQIINLKKVILRTDLLDNEEDIRNKQNLWVDILVNAIDEINELRSREDGSSEKYQDITENTENDSGIDRLHKIEQLERENKQLADMLQKEKSSTADDLRKSLDDAVLRIFELENEHDQLKKGHELIDTELRKSLDKMKEEEGKIKSANERITELEEELNQSKNELNVLKIKSKQNMIDQREDFTDNEELNSKIPEDKRMSLIVHTDSELEELSKLRNSCRLLVMELLSQDLAEPNNLDEQITQASVKIRDMKKNQHDVVYQRLNEDTESTSKPNEMQPQQCQDTNEVQKYQSDMEIQLALDLQNARSQITSLQSDNEALKNQLLLSNKESPSDVKGDNLVSDIENDLRIQISNLEIELELAHEQNLTLENERYELNTKYDSLATSDNQNADNASAANSLSYHNKTKMMQMISFVISNIDKATYEEPDVKDSIAATLQDIRRILEIRKFDNMDDTVNNSNSLSYSVQGIDNSANAAAAEVELSEKLNAANSRLNVLEVELDYQKKAFADKEVIAEKNKIELHLQLEESEKRIEEVNLQRLELEESLAKVHHELNVSKSKEIDLLADEKSIQQIMTSLEAEVEGLKIDLNVARQSEELAKEENAKTLKALEQTEYDLQSQADEAESLRKNCSDLTRSLTDIQEKVLELQLARDNIINEYKVEKDKYEDLERTIDDLRESLQSVEADKENIENDKLRIEELELLLSRKEDEYNTRISTLTSEKDQALEVINTLQIYEENSVEAAKKLTEIQEEYEAAIMKITALTEENDSLKALNITVSEQKEAISEYVKLIAERESEINATKLVIGQEKESVNQMQIALESMENDKKNMLAAHEQEKCNLQQLLDDNEIKLRDSEQVCEDLTLQCEELEDKLKEALECAQRSLHEVDGAREDILNLKKTTEDYQQLRLSYQELTHRVVDLENEKLQITTNYEERIKELQTSLHKTHTKMNEITDNQVEIESDRNLFLKNALEESNSKAKSLEIALEYQEAQSAELLAVREKLIHELEASRKMIDEQKQIKENLSKSINELSNNYDQLKDQSSNFTLSQQDRDSKLNLLLEEAHTNYSLLEKNYDEERKKNSKLESTLNTVNNRIEELRNMLDERNNRIVDLETSLHVSIKDLEVSVNKQMLAQQSNDLLNERLSMQEAKLKHISIDKTKLEEELSQILEQLRNKGIALLESQQVVSELSQQIDHLKTQYTDLENHSKLEENSAVEELSRKVTSLQLRLKEVEGKNEVLTESLNAKNAQLHDVGNKLLDKEEVINGFKDHVNELNLKLVEAEEGRKTLLTQSSQLRDSLQDITKEKELAAAKYAELVSSSTLTASERDLYVQALDKVNTLTNEKVVAEQMYSDSLNERDKTIAERDYMLMQKDNVIRENMAALVDANAAKNRLEVELKGNESLKEEIDTLRSLLQQSEEDMIAMKKRSNELRNELETADNRCMEMDIKKTSICEQKIALQERVEITDRKCADLEKSLKEASEQLQDSHSQIETLQEKNEISIQKLKMMDININSLKELENKVHEQDIVIEELTATLQSYKEETTVLKTKNDDILQELSNFSACKEENKTLLSQIETLNQKISKQSISVEKKSSNEHDIAIESLQDELEDVREEKESLEKQVNFLNDVIVDMQKKIVDASDSIQKLEKKLVEKEASHDITKNKSPLGSPNFSKKGRPSERPYCSFCEVFDAHSSDNCPKLDSSSLSSSPRRYNRFSRFSSSSNDFLFCDICGQSGHSAENCDDDTIF